MEERAVGSSAQRSALGIAYVMNFGALAASSPFLAVHLGASGYSPSAGAQLLAVLLLVRVAAIPAWTLFADRAGTIGGALRLASVGALASFAALLIAPGAVGVAACLFAFSLFRAPFGALLDTIALRGAREASDQGSAFGAVRAWGTAGYALGALVTGAFVAREGSRAVVYVTTVLLGGAVAASWALPARDPNRTEHLGHGGGQFHLLGSLLRRPRVLLLFAVASLQEIGLSPYDALFPAYLTKIAGATSAGVAIALGAGAEFLFLLGGASLARRLGPERLLVAGCAASVVRWATIALTTSSALLVGIQVLHALSFGAFYLASVVLMDGEAPPSLRASAQGIFGSFAFGIAAALALSFAGLVERRAGTPMIFAIGAGASVIATLIAALLRPLPATPA